jgi:hypothetical protein
MMMTVYLMMTMDELHDDLFTSDDDDDDDDDEDDIYLR